MPESTFILLTVFCSLSFSLAVLLTVLLVASYNQSRREIRTTYQTLLAEQMVENQKLRNQLRTLDVSVLAGLNHATLPADNTEHLTSEPTEINSIASAIDVEDLLAQRGYEQGTLSEDLESAGWPRPVIKKDEHGDPIAYDAT